MRRFLGPVATGVLLAAAFPPLDLGPLVLVAPVPLFVSWWRAGSARRAALDGLVAGAVFFGALLLWVWHFGVVAYFPFVAVLAAYWAGAGALVGAFGARGLRSPWLVAATWVLFEALRGRWPLGGFSWGELGYAVHDIPVLRTLAAWGGVLGVSFVVALLAAAGAAALAGERGRGARRLGVLTAGAAVVVVAAHALLPRTDPTETLRVAVLQGNDRNRRLTTAEIRDRFLPRSHFDLAAELDDDVDLVVFPESSLDEDPRIDPGLDAGLAATARRLGAGVLANASVEVDAGRRLENTNLFYDPDGRLEGTYVKQHLVPFGEYVPGRSFLGFVDELEQIPRDYVPGDSRRSFTAAGVRFGNLICFESAFTEIARAYARDDAELLVVSTNNRSFRRSANSAQHVAIGQMRAIETGRPLVHAGISGRSAFVEPDGDVVAAAGLFERTALVHTVTGRTGPTPYVLLGDWVILAAAAVVLAGAWRVRGGQFARPGGPS